MLLLFSCLPNLSYCYMSIVNFRFCFFLVLLLIVRSAVCVYTIYDIPSLTITSCLSIDLRRFHRVRRANAKYHPFIIHCQ